MQLYERSFVIRAGEPVFAGHFPGRPILPGVVLLALVRETLAAAEGRPFRLLGIERQKFTRPVIPTTEVKVECQVKTRQDGVLTLRCRFILPDGQLAAKADLSLEAE